MHTRLQRQENDSKFQMYGSDTPSIYNLSGSLRMDAIAQFDGFFACNAFFFFTTFFVFFAIGLLALVCRFAPPEC